MGSECRGQGFVTNERMREPQLDTGKSNPVVRTGPWVTEQGSEPGKRYSSSRFLHYSNSLW